MSQGKLDMVKQEMARMNINILGISELKWMGTCAVLSCFRNSNSYDPMDCSPPGSSVHGILQDDWSGLPCLPPGNLPNPGIEPTSPALLHCRWILYPPSHLGSPKWMRMGEFNSGDNIISTTIGRIL